MKKFPFLFCSINSNTSNQMKAFASNRWRHWDILKYNQFYCNSWQLYKLFHAHYPGWQSSGTISDTEKFLSVVAKVIKRSEINASCAAFVLCLALWHYGIRGQCSMSVEYLCSECTVCTVPRMKEWSFLRRYVCLSDCLDCQLILEILRISVNV